MIKLEYDPSVLSALQVAFPKPKNSAKRQLDKYVNLLEVLIHMSMFKRSNYARITKSYDIPLKTIWRLGPTINNREYRVHEWLEKNGFALVKNIRSDASNLTNEHALLRPTSLLIIKNENLLNDLRLKTPSELDNYLDELTEEWISKVNYFQSDYLSSSERDKENLFHTTEVDIISLQNFMRKLVNGDLKLNRIQEETSIFQAELILRTAQVNNGLLHQKIDKKAFGRTYYEGQSVQSVSKQLRETFLGDSYEYDCKSCSTSWKIAFAYEWHSQKKRRKYSIAETFSAMTFYLNNKQMFFDFVSNQIFLNSSLLDASEKTAILKEAMTALGFGAKLSVGKWRDVKGEEKMTSLKDVFKKDIETLTRFINCSLVKKFNEEQAVLNKFIVNKFLVDKQWLLDMEEEEKRKKCKFTQAQRVVWLFQHAETIMMDKVIEELKKLNKTVLANVHDAIVIREKLSEKELEMIETEVRQYTKVEYFALGETHYQSSNNI